LENFAAFVHAKLFLDLYPIQLILFEKLKAYWRQKVENLPFFHESSRSGTTVTPHLNQSGLYKLLNVMKKSKSLLKLENEIHEKEKSE
jgi:hypothetical protein